MFRMKRIKYINAVKTQRSNKDVSAGDQTAWQYQYQGCFNFLEQLTTSQSIALVIKVFYPTELFFEESWCMLNH